MVLSCQKEGEFRHFGPFFVPKRGRRWPFELASGTLKGESVVSSVVFVHQEVTKNGDHTAESSGPLRCALCYSIGLAT